MKELYSIGETARLLGVSTQTLRFYDKCGLLRPRQVDPRTGYRYYAFNQFHYIDRIKYLQSFGMSLEDIKKVMDQGSVDWLVAFLQRQRAVKQAELDALQATLDTMDWYIEYFTFLERENNADAFYMVHLPVRYAIGVPGYPDDLPISKMEVRLAEAKARAELRGLSYRRQYAYIVNFQRLLQAGFEASRYFIYLSKKPDFETEYLLELPAGDYLCYRARILTDYWDPSPLARYFHGTAPKLVIANEFEENLIEYSQTQYELQFLL